MREEPGDLIIPAPITAEVDYLIRRRGTADAARQFLRDIARGSYRVESLTADEHKIVAALDEHYADLDAGLADLSVVVLAHRFRTNRILTFDARDFRTLRPLSGGAFTLLPADR